ncbi:MAG TPA: DeoR/GlpR family DNA-binding transcription regulator [Streptosporangiaceae bacterium]|nr:DeoR/GlpR family DNA-binding transcription regulator [Streptosporangiaceae bacterium]
MNDDEGFRYTTAPERREQLVQFINEQGYCTISELSKTFAVSEMTIRRDVMRLVERDRVRSFRGGVGTLSRQDLLGSDYRKREVAMLEAKRAIAARAVAMIEADSVIALDAGTTTSQVALLLPYDRNLRVVTHSLPVVSGLVGNAGVEVLCLGGTLHPESLSFDGPSTLATISNLQVQTLFLATTGMNQRGAFCGNGYDAITKRALVEVAERVVLIADSSKFQNQAMVKVCGWDAIDILIVDDAITAEQVGWLEQHDVDVVPVAAEVLDDPATLASGAAS